MLAEKDFLNAAKQGCESCDAQSAGDASFAADSYYEQTDFTDPVQAAVSGATVSATESRQHAPAAPAIAAYVAIFSLYKHNARQAFLDAARVILGKRSRRIAAGVAAAMALPTLGVVTALGVAPGSVHETVPQNLVLKDIPISADAIAEQAGVIQNYVFQERILRGDTVAALMQRLNAVDATAFQFLTRDGTAKGFLSLKPGRIVVANVNAAKQVQSLRYFQSSSSYLELTRTDAGFVVTERAIAEVPRLIVKSGVISSSLFGATDSAGVPDAVATQLAKIFSTDIDFHIDLRKGDRFSVAYEAFYDHGELIRTGRITAAEFQNKNYSHTAVLFKGTDGDDAYYSINGENRARGFLRSPVEFSRVSSGFGGRIHPIFKQWRAHTGTDFAAPIGTKVMSAGDGVIESAGWKNGYGNTLEIKHGGETTTLYAHLNSFATGIVVGKKVKQGEVVAYVGKTGWATGAHLHYEFKVAGVHQDPLTVALPKASPLPVAQKGQFDKVAAGANASFMVAQQTHTANFE